MGRPEEASAEFGANGVDLVLDHLRQVLSQPGGGAQLHAAGKDQSLSGPVTKSMGETPRHCLMSISGPSVHHWSVVG